MNHGWHEGVLIGPTGSSLIGVIARLQEQLTEYRDTLMRLYQDTVPPGWHCHRCGGWPGGRMTRHVLWLRWRSFSG